MKLSKLRVFVDKCPIVIEIKKNEHKCKLKYKYKYAAENALRGLSFERIVQTALVQSNIHAYGKAKVSISQSICRIVIIIISEDTEFR